MAARKTSGRKAQSGIHAESGSTALDRMVMAYKKEPGGPGGTMMLDDCMTYDPDIAGKVPLRYRIIALGFARGSSIQELNEKLQEEGCGGLYARSVWEASIIYAFVNGLSYQEWKELQGICNQVRAEKELRDRFFQERKVTYRDLRDYVEANSDLSSQQAVTQHVTRAMNNKLREIARGKGEFRDFLEHNIESMSPVREKTRYYFCKYLYYYLTACMERYLEARRTGQAGGAELDELAVFKGLTTLKRKKLTDEEVRAVLSDSAISFGAVFDAFNYFFFDYVSLDWMEVLLEYYGDIGSIPASDRRRLAASLRRYEPKKYKGLNDEEVLRAKQQEQEDAERMLDEKYSLDGRDKGYQLNRAGENAIRRYVKGGLDIDRTTLICFLVFFGSKTELPPELRIDRRRLTDILIECDFAGLRDEDEFDDFIIRFLESDDPVDLLMEEVTDYALYEENFFLYRMYLASRSAESDIRELVDGQD